MCPDPQLISVFFDGELPSPWKEKMESHLAQCTHCASKLEKYTLLSRNNGDAPHTSAVTAAGNRVWEKLEEKTKNSSPGIYRPVFRPIVFWNRRVSVPLPAAAAAVVLLVIALAALWTVQRRDHQTISNITVTSEEYSLWPAGIDNFDSPGMVPVTNLNEVLQYLGSRDSGDIVILRLPETRSFFSSGEPAIIKAADYSRRRP